MYDSSSNCIAFSLEWFSNSEGAITGGGGHRRVDSHWLYWTIGRCTRRVIIIHIVPVRLGDKAIH